MTTYQHQYCACDRWYTNGTSIRFCEMTTQHLKNAKRWLLDQEEGSYDPIREEYSSNEEWIQEKLDQIEEELERREQIDRQLLQNDLRGIEWHE